MQFMKLIHILFYIRIKSINSEKNKQTKKSKYVKSRFKIKSTGLKLRNYGMK